MKIIPKFQAGGGFPSSFAVYTPFSMQQKQTRSTQTQETTTKQNKSKGDDDDDMLKQITSLIKSIDLLPNEMESIQQQISQILRLSELPGYDSSYINTLYSRVMMQLKNAKFNKDEYDKAYALTNKTGGLNEVAIENGMIYVYDKDQNLQSISIDEYLKNKTNFSTPISVSNLMWLRAHDPRFANQNKVFTIVDNSIGMNEVVKQIQNCLGTLGSDSEEIGGYVKKGSGKQVISGIESLQKLAQQQGEAAINGIYKVTTKQKDSTKQAQAAIEYIWQSLTPNAQDLLRLKAGNANNPTMGALNYLSKKVMSVMNNTIFYNEDYQDDFDETGKRIPKKDKSGSSDEEGESGKFKENATMRYMQGRGYPSTVQIVPGSNQAGEVSVITAPITDNEGKTWFGQYLNELKGTSSGNILNLKNATMGMHKIKLPQQVELLDNKMHSIYWPTLEDGVTPDLRTTTVEAMKQATEEIKLSGVSPNSSEAKAIYNKYNVPNPHTIRRFTILDAMTNSNAIGVDAWDDDPLLEEVDDATFEQYEKSFEQYFSKNGSKTKMGLDKFSWINPADWFGNYDEVYKGTVWIPNEDNWSNAMIGKDILTQDAQIYDQYQYNSDQDFKAAMNYTDPNTLIGNE